VISERKLRPLARLPHELQLAAVGWLLGSGNLVPSGTGRPAIVAATDGDGSIFPLIHVNRKEAT
jgi:hypothetical protein